MKKLWILFLLITLLLVGCNNHPVAPTVQPAPTEDTTGSTETSPTPEMLIGTWRSLDPGELDMVETIEISSDGYIFVSCTYQGQDAGTISGTYYVIGETLHCDMTANNAPYIVDYRFVIDGRELTLQDDDGAAHYIKVS